MQHLQSNTTLQGGKYRIERMLGQGGFGITYLARNTMFDVNVAIKEFFMRDENERDGLTVTVPTSVTKRTLFEGQKEKFKKEAKRMFGIKCEHIVAVHDLFEENGTVYYVMDYVDGKNLSERLKCTGKPLPEKEVREILPQILDALKTVHNAGIWHLDLKPANIMVDKTGNVKLIDFGASKQLNTQKGGATTSTAVSYTNGYAPREQMEQSYDKFGPWTDIYALGATLYNLLTNRRPPMPTDIDDDTSVDKHNSLPLSGVSESMKKLILSMMQTNRMKRPQDVSEISNLIVNSPEVSFLKSEHSFNNETQKEADEVTVIEKPYIQKPISNPSELGTLELGEKKKGRWPLYTLLITLAVLLLVGIGLLCAILLKQNESNSNNTETTSQHTVNSSSQSVNSDAQYDMNIDKDKTEDESRARNHSEEAPSEIQDILNALDNNINVLDTYNLRELYSDYVRFYGTVMSRDNITTAIETQRNKFPYYKQKSYYPRVIELNDRETRCDYIKRVTIDGNTTDYEAYIVLERDGMGSYVIKEESDKTTDRNLEKQSRR